MSYTTYFLKFTDKATFDSVADAAGYKFSVGPDAELSTGEDFYYDTHAVSGPGAIDIIGTLYNDDAVYGEADAEGNVPLVTPPTSVPGYHVNICLRSDVTIPTEFDSYILDPAPVTPSRTFG